MKKTAITLAVGILLGIGIGASPRLVAEPQGRYKVFRPPFVEKLSTTYEGYFTAALNEEARNGWEFCGTLERGYVVLKR